MSRPHTIFSHSMTLALLTNSAVLSLVLSSAVLGCGGGSSGKAACATCCDCVYQCGSAPENITVISNPNSPDRCLDCQVACEDRAYARCMSPVVSAYECKSSPAGGAADASLPSDVLPPTGLDGMWVHEVDSSARRVYKFRGEKYDFSDGPYLLGDSVSGYGTWRLSSASAIEFDGFCRTQKETGYSSSCNHKYSFAYVGPVHININGEAFRKITNCKTVKWEVLRDDGTGYCIARYASCAQGYQEDGAGSCEPSGTKHDAASDVNVGVADTAPDPYIWVVIQDIGQVACTTNGPGADIDAVALLDKDGSPIGWGMKTWAMYTPNPGGYACANEDCSGGNCKYAANSKTIPLATLVSYAEGPADATVNAKGDDTGYFSLNAGTLQIKMGDLNGDGPARPLYPGDFIAVSEVDKSYITTGNAPATCICVPEHYTVALQTATGVALPLKPVTLSLDNTTCSPLTPTSTEGCGSTVFQFP